MSWIKKIFLLSQIAFSNPKEFMDRLEAILTYRVEQRFGRPGNYYPQTVKDMVDSIEQFFKTLIDWQGVDEIEREVNERMEDLEGALPFTTRHHGDIGLAKVCYAACRLLQPEIVIETGVAYGVTTAFILEALQRNKKGKLFSIDLPPLGEKADAFVGFLVPEVHKERWTLHRGTSKRILPKLLPQLGHVDLFVHDSLHTYWNIRRELRIVAPYLARPSIIIADDIQGNQAFAEWVAKYKPALSGAFQEEGKDVMAGFAAFLQDEHIPR
jgi:hypothetical protein